MQNETLSRRLNLLSKPSTVEQAKKIAWIKQMSFNALANLALESYIASNVDLVAQYDKIFNESINAGESND